jgi:uncharacterized membrane protein YjgN (DUF898 family)
MEQVHAPSQTDESFLTKAPPQVEQCAFTGTGDGYAKVFFANLALNLITFGFYSPWAKVRRLKYFHHNTVLAGSSFEYTANPWSICKGRLIVLGLFIVFSALSAVPILNVVLYLAFMCVVPRLILQTYRFRARYTEYRGLKFHFNGTTWEIFLYSILYRFLAFIPLGLLVPTARAAERRYIMSQLQFGTARFTGRTTTRDFWEVYLTVAGVAFLAFIPIICFFAFRAFLAIFFASPADENTASYLNTFGPALLTIAINVLIVLAIGPLFHALVGKITWNDATVGDATITYKPSGKSVLTIGLVNAVLIMCSLGLAYPWCAVRLLKYKMSCLSVASAAGVQSFVGTQQAEVQALGDQAAEVLDMDLDFGF